MPRTIVFESRKFKVARDVSPGPRGNLLERDVVLHPGAVAILPLVDADHLCLLRNQRFAVAETLWEIPAGTLEPGEDPARAAARELAEETGYRAERLHLRLTFYPSPGILNEKMYLYIAENLTPGPLDLQADEQIQPTVVSWSQALTWARDGTIRDAKTLVALLLDSRPSGPVL
jgi:ADP-ribose pyrophosphatase